MSYYTVRWGDTVNCGRNAGIPMFDCDHKHKTREAAERCMAAWISRCGDGRPFDLGIWIQDTDDGCWVKWEEGVDVRVVGGQLTVVILDSADRHTIDASHGPMIEGDLWDDRPTYRSLQQARNEVGRSMANTLDCVPIDGLEYDQCEDALRDIWAACLPGWKVAAIRERLHQLQCDEVDGALQEEEV